MGNWHCVPSGCAEVVYQEYLPPVVRWRYPEEEWREIKADDYSFTEKTICPGVPHVFYYRNAIINTFQCTLTGWSNEFIRSGWLGSTSPPFTNFRLYSGNILIAYAATPEDWAGNIEKPFWSYWRSSTFFCGENVPNHGTGRFFLYCDSAVGKDHLILNSTSRGILPYGFQPDPNANLSPCQNSCVFKITKNGQTVHTETRSVCPEVEKIPCRLSDQPKKIEIEKIPYLERVEVVPYAYSAYRLPGLPAPIAQADPIPDECLNIYNNAIYVVPPNPEALNNPDSTPFDTFIAQICSAPGCPPPEYGVLCDDQCFECTECPPGTHPITCDDTVCCYGDDGRVVLEIPKFDYCGGDSCCG